jgi:FeS assembly SUF system protein
METKPKAVPLNMERIGAANPKTEEAVPVEGDLRERVVATLKTCYDPEVPVNIYELGLIYDVGISDDGDVHVKMTLTSPACPVAGSLPGEVETKLRKLAGAKSVKVELVWEPPWDKDRMSEAAQLQLGLF